MKQTSEPSVDDNPAEKKRNCRRWFQFSLRSLLMMMLVFGCGLGWFTAKRRQAQQAWKRIEEAEKLDINLIAVDDNRAVGGIHHEGTWLEEWLGISLPEPLISAKVNTSSNPTPELQELAKFPELTDIWLEVDDITDEQLAPLAGMKRLTTLQIAWSPLRGSGLAYLAGNDSLEELNLVQCENLTDEAIYSIPKLPSLTQLTIDNCPLTGISLGHLATACPNLETLILADAPLTLEGIQEIGTLHSLKSLTINHVEIDNIGLSYLNDLVTLRELYCHPAEFSDVGLEHLSKHPLLENLLLSEMPITDVGMAHLSNLLELKKVDLERTDISDQGLQHIQSQKLESLRLNYTSITDSSVSQLTRFPRLQILELSGTKITDACVSELAKLPQLEALTLDKTAITEEALSHLLHNKKLKSLTLPKMLRGTRGASAVQLNNRDLVISFL